MSKIKVSRSNSCYWFNGFKVIIFDELLSWHQENNIFYTLHSILMVFLEKCVLYYKVHKVTESMWRWLHATMKSFLSIGLYRFEALLCRMSRLQTAVLSSARCPGACLHVSVNIVSPLWPGVNIAPGPVTSSIIIPRSHVLWLIFRCSQLSSLCPLTLAVTEHIFSLLTVFIRI